ncbi:hypothetical protein DHEL01_v206892 [Diaporthe helianthi]|uniref:AB hydrolase-1 domain-containing protein n=1 Tax=Diaporthe helianthi TaxID=158607 RepID=A0A2P5HWU2_DIAHE|nr:hypothetical protein DHEL01_v206892 [Diaporthe helianthi]
MHWNPYRHVLLTWAVSWAGLALASDPACIGINAVKPECTPAEPPYHRDVFFVGGEYVTSGTSVIISDQMYVEKLTPTSGVDKPFPIVFISAGLPAGNVWLNTPDNRKGWAAYFLEKGHQLYIVDITGNGRSGQNDISKYPLRLGSTVSIHEDGFTAPEILNAYPQSQGHDKWPGNGTQGDPVFDAFFASTVPLTSNSNAQELSMRAAGCKLLSLIGQSFLVGHSAGATYSALMSDECPEQVRATINLEPGNIPFQSLIGNATVPSVGRTRSRPWGLTNSPVTYDPPVVNVTEDLITVEVGADTPALRSCYLQSNATVVRSLPQIAKVPYVMFTAANSPHIAYDHCFVSYLHQAGVKDVTWVKFGELGLVGNGHFFFLEENNMELAAVVEQEIAGRS